MFAYGVIANNVGDTKQLERSRRRGLMMAGLTGLFGSRTSLGGDDTYAMPLRPTADERQERYSLGFLNKR